MNHQLPVVPPIMPPVPPRVTTNASNNFPSARQVSNLRKTLENGKSKNICYLKLAFPYCYPGQVWLYRRIYINFQILYKVNKTVEI